MRQTLMMLLAGMVCGCWGSDAASTQSVVTPVPSQVPPATTPSTGSPPGSAGGGESCESLTRTACMRSTACTLEQEAERSNRYRCRPATEPCERGFAQAGFWGSGTEGVRASKDQQAACNARPGCGFVDGGCYCHCRGMGQTTVPDGYEAEDCDCVCAGGPPPTCRALE